MESHEGLNDESPFNAHKVVTGVVDGFAALLQGADAAKLLAASAMCGPTRPDPDPDSTGQRRKPPMLANIGPLLSKRTSSVTACHSQAHLPQTDKRQLQSPATRAQCESDVHVRYTYRICYRRQSVITQPAQRRDGEYRSRACNARRRRRHWRPATAQNVYPRQPLSRIVRATRARRIQSAVARSRLRPSISCPGHKAKTPCTLRALSCVVEGTQPASPRARRCRPLTLAADSRKRTSSLDCALKQFIL